MELTLTKENEDKRKIWKYIGVFGIFTNIASTTSVACRTITVRIFWRVQF